LIKALFWPETRVTLAFEPISRQGAEEREGFCALLLLIEFLK